MEKGLVSRPRKPVFAKEYIAETVVSFIKLQGCELHAGLDISATLQWASDVLSQYFLATENGNDSEIALQRELFEKVPSVNARNDQLKAPKKRDLTPLSFNVEDMLQLAIRRRSIRWYQDRKVCRKSIDRAVEIAGYSPSACNRQPFEFRVFDDSDLITRLSSIPLGTRGFSHQFPVFIVVIGKLRAYPLARDRHVIYIDASLAAMALEFALELQGISTCSINWPDIKDLERKMAEEIGLEPDERIVMCISAGYPDPDGLVPYSQKKSIEELRSYNQL
ncbi:nitroreductase family protein [Novipirellula herctigrandis]|uniref:nitroreductase family protein n=1 Tax=Novipirellula herctigrandis TaxID=2527986 RepID=UPI003AF36D25